MKDNRQASVFGKRKEPHTVIIARGDEVRHFTIRPWMAATIGSMLAALAIGYLLATSYLVLRDDLLGAANARNARLQQAYEDRISLLRAQVDRITSRQLLDQQIVEGKVTELLERQSQLTQRHGRMEPILERANGLGGTLPGAAPMPDARPGEKHAGMVPARGSVLGDLKGFLASSGEGGLPETSADRADRMFVELNRSLRRIETEQMKGIEAMADDAFQRADQIENLLESAGLPVSIDTDASASGGPLIPLDASANFDARVRELDDALEKLAAMKAIATDLPIHNPAPGQSVSSSYGVRRDPLIGRPAMHAGIDFRGAVGTPIRSAGAGKVVKAGWNGGYGRMVEVDHGNGFTTRYAHMSKIRVSEGDEVRTGDVVGEVGSSGRSTGPHLHYEVRRGGSALDPLRFLKVGKKVVSLL